MQSENASVNETSSDMHPDFAPEEQTPVPIDSLGSILFLHNDFEMQT